MVFETWRKTAETLAEPEMLISVPLPPNEALRDEPDNDPLVEEMTQRLRDGLRNMVAVDEWGRELSWRNVVRMAVGPLSAELRDAQTAVSLAQALSPTLLPEEETGRHVQAETPAPVAEEPAPEAPIAAVQEAAATIEEPTPPAAEEPPAPTLAVAPVVEIVKTPPPVVPVVSPMQGTPPTASATSIFIASGNQRPVTVSPFGAGQLLGGSGADDTTTAKYDRFLTSLYGERQQVGGDQDGGAGGTSLGNDLQGGINS